MKQKGLLYFSSAINLLFISGLLIIAFSFGGFEKLMRKLRYYPINTHYAASVKTLESYPVVENQIVMLGNSLTAGGQWHELLGRKDIINRGIPGETADGILARISDIINRKPKLVIVMVGINDLTVRGRSADEVFGFYEKIINNLSQAKIPVLVQSTLLIHGQNEVNKKIISLNNKLQSFCQSSNQNWLDLNKSLSPAGELDVKYSYDDLHLNAQGYEVWASELKNWLLVNKF